MIPETKPRSHKKFLLSLSGLAGERNPLITFEPVGGFG
jgi:hypothetical protein